MNKKTTLLTLGIFLGVGNLKAQQVHTVPLTNAEVSENSLRPFLSGISNTSLTSGATLNTFFAAKVSAYLSEATDLSLSRAYAVLDNSDGRLFLGGTFNAKQSTNDFQRFLFTAGVKANVKDGFANLFGSDGINRDIGISFKTTIFGRGTIWFDKNPASQKNKVENKRKEIVNELLGDFDTELSKFKRNQTGLTGAGEAITSFVSDHEDEMKTKFAQKEADYISRKKLFNLAHTWWVSGEVYLPVSRSSYQGVDDFSSTALKSRTYRPYELNLTYTNFWDKNKWTRNIFLWKGSTLLTFKGALLADNSVNASIIDEYSFDEFLTQNTASDTLFLAKLKSKAVYVGKFETFITPAISARYVYMPLPFIGISGAVEKYFGKTEALNWRLGVPVSLKDREGKSKINFELVWREIRKAHSFGLSVGLPIGGTIF